MMVDGVFSQLDEVIATLADVDVDTLAPSELDALVVGLQRARHRLAGVSAGRVGPLGHGRGVALRRVPHARPVAWLVMRRRRCRRRTSSCGGPTSCRRCRSPRRRWWRGGSRWITSTCWPAPINRIVITCSPATKRCWSSSAPRCVTTRSVKAVEYWCQSADGETGESTHRPARRPPRRCTPPPRWTARSGSTARLDAIDGAIVTGELARLERQLYLADQAAGITRTHGERLAAALVEMATRSASTPAGAQRPKPLFTALVGDDTVDPVV